MSHGFSNRIISDSNTPMPPGTWLTSAMSCDARNAPRKNVKSGRHMGSSTYSTAPASAQSSAESTNWDAMSGGDGSEMSVPATETGCFQNNGAAA